MVASQGIDGLRVDTKKNPPWTLVIDFNPDALVSFEAAAVRNNGAITKLTLPKVAKIGRYAFYGNGATEIIAHVPLSEMFGYATDLRSKSQGRAQYSMEPSHFAEVPKSIQEKLANNK